MATFGDRLIIDELIARPGQSRYRLASQIRVSPMELDDALTNLVKMGSVVRSEVTGDSEPLYWAAVNQEPFLQK